MREGGLRKGGVEVGERQGEDDEGMEVERERFQGRVDILQVKRDRMVVEVMTLWVEMAVGGDLEELR